MRFLMYSLFKIVFTLAFLASVNMWAATPQDIDSKLPDDTLFEQWYEAGVTFEGVQTAGGASARPHKRIAAYAKFLKKKKRTEGAAGGAVARVSKHFFGSPAAAVDANAEALEQYEHIFKTLAQGFDKGEFGEGTYNEARALLLALKIWHENLREISKELNNRASGASGPFSKTYAKKFREALPRYGDAPSLHIEGNRIGLPFEQKPGFLLASFIEALELATENGILKDLLNKFLGVSGCLEAHFGAVTEWNVTVSTAKEQGKALVRGTSTVMDLLAKEFQLAVTITPCSKDRLRAQKIARTFFGVDELNEDQVEFMLRAIRVAAAYANGVPSARTIEFVARILRQAEGNPGSLHPTPERSLTTKRKAPPSPAKDITNALAKLSSSEMAHFAAKMASLSKKAAIESGLNQFAETHNFYNPALDGACFFHALAYAFMGADTPENVSVLQQAGLNYVAGNPGEFVNFMTGATIEEQQANLNTFIEDNLDPGEWAGNHIIQAIVTALGIQLTVHQHLNNGVVTPYIFGNGIAVVLHNYDNFHYLAPLHGGAADVAMTNVTEPAPSAPTNQGADVARHLFGPWS